MNKSESPIMVVGGRTTGLTMACELARHGAPVQIIDKSPGIDPHCRATVLHSRTLEIFQDPGIVDAIFHEGLSLMGGCQYANGQLFMHARYGDVDSPYRCAVSLGQNRTEAGDAVHVHSLMGALGMNTGIRDAYNLPWKLALVMRGKAPEFLLDSYEIERRQVGEDVVKTTKNITESAELFSHLAPAEREKLPWSPP